MPCLQLCRAAPHELAPAVDLTLPGPLKINVVNLPAKKKHTGIDPFTKQERDLDAKPATDKIKTRALKKL